MRLAEWHHVPTFPPTKALSRANQSIITTFTRSSRYPNGQGHAWLGAQWGLDIDNLTVDDDLELLAWLNAMGYDYAVRVHSR